MYLALCSIDKRRKDVMDRRQKVKDQAAERHNALLGSQAYQEFKRDAAEVSIYSPFSEIYIKFLEIFKVCMNKPKS